MVTRLCIALGGLAKLALVPTPYAVFQQEQNIWPRYGVSVNISGLDARNN